MKNKMLAISIISIAILMSGCNKFTETSKTDGSANSGKTVEQTICFSQENYGGVYIGVLGDDIALNGGQCKGVKLADMNKKGWRLVNVVSGMNNSFGMVFEK